MVGLVRAEAQRQRGRHGEQGGLGRDGAGGEQPVGRPAQRQQRNEQDARVEERQQRLVPRQGGHGRPGQREGFPAGEQDERGEPGELERPRPRRRGGEQHGQQQPANTA